MKPVKLAAFVLTLTVPALSMAQPPEGDRPDGPPPEGREERNREGGPDGRPRFPNPVLEAIDADKNGELSAEEIANAATALKTLDKNSDGKLDMAETRPNFEGMGRGFGGPPGGPPGGGQGSGSEEMMNRLIAMDANKNGKLEKEEVPERMQSMFSRADKNEDGAIDKEEMTAMARERAGGQGGGFGGGQGGPGSREFLAQMMERADADKDGKLIGDEIPLFMRERLEQTDTNKDGALDKAELEAAASRMAEGRGQGRGRGQRPPVEGEGEPKSEEKKPE
jgi:Ca2+-binding EF-hand superfamily protein